MRYTTKNRIKTLTEMNHRYVEYFNELQDILQKMQGDIEDLIMIINRGKNGL